MEDLVMGLFFTALMILEIIVRLIIPVILIIKGFSKHNKKILYIGIIYMIISILYFVYQIL